MIQSVLRQTYDKWELIIVDDGSPVGALDEVFGKYPDPRIKWIWQTNQGVTKAVNTAFQHATGDLVQPLSADEWIEPTKLEEQVAYLTSHPEISAVFGLPKAGDQYELGAYNRSRADWLVTLLALDRVPLSSASALWRRSLFDDIGYFDEDFRITSDLEWYVRLFREKEVRMLPKLWAGSRQRSDAISSLNQKNSIAMREEMERVNSKHKKEGKLTFTGKLIIATPFYEMKGFSPYIKSLVETTRLLERLKVNWEYWPLEGYSYVDEARNVTCARFLEDTEATDLLFIDSDEGWGGLGLLRLLMSSEEVIGGLYPLKNDWDGWKTSPYFWATQDDQPIGKKTPDGGAILKADMLPAGFMRIKRSALERFRDSYPDLRFRNERADVSAPDREYTAFFERTSDAGEDVNFCRRWKAIGGELWIEPRISITHYGIKGWFGNLDGYLRSLK